jgi:hypothetical protein
VQDWAKRKKTSCLKARSKPFPQINEINFCCFRRRIVIAQQLACAPQSDELAAQRMKKAYFKDNRSIDRQ